MAEHLPEVGKKQNKRLQENSLLLILIVKVKHHRRLSMSTCEVFLDILHCCTIKLRHFIKIKNYLKFVLTIPAVDLVQCNTTKLTRGYRA
jgi:hypothetical protein